MTETLWIQITLAGGLGIALVVLAMGIRRRKHREWLSRLSSKYSLGVVEAGASRDANELAAMYEGDKKRIDLGDTFVGSDDHGRYFAAERRRGRRREHVLFFEPEQGTHLSGFSFTPRAGRGRPFVGKMFGKGRQGHSGEGSDFSLSWSAPRPQWGDQRGLAVAARVLFHAAQIMEDSPLDCLHLRIDQRRVLVRSERRLAGGDLDRFLADATALRRRVLESLRRVKEASGPSSGATAAVAKRKKPALDGRVQVLR